MLKKCIVCGKEFKFPPSGKTITCGKECSAIRKRQSHLGKGTPWSSQSREQLALKGQTANLLKGTSAAKMSPKSGRFTSNVNAIDWHLISPEGVHYHFHSLNFWLRENCREIFGIEPDTREFLNVRSGLCGAKRAVLGKNYGCCTYKGWKVVPTKDDEQNGAG